MRFHDAVGLSAALMLTAAAPVALAADHGDTPTLGGVPRHDLNLTDLHVFTSGSHARRLVIALSTNDAIPNLVRNTSAGGSVSYRGNVAYQFPSDLQIRILIDNHSKVTFANARDLATYGGTIVNPSLVGPDVQLTVNFDDAGKPRISGSGLDDGDDSLEDVAVYAGLRDDPFIRGPRKDRNVGTVVLELPLHLVAHGRNKTILVWAASQSLSALSAQTPPFSNPNQIADRTGRAFRSMFDQCLNNNMLPSADGTNCGLVPDAVIFDTTRPASFPNGRLLSDDVSAYLAQNDPAGPVAKKIIPGDGSPRATTNDAPFSNAFPYLAPPHEPGCYCSAATGAPAICNGLRSHGISGYTGCYLPDTGYSLGAAESSPSARQGDTPNDDSDGDKDDQNAANPASQP